MDFLKVALLHLEKLLKNYRPLHLMVMVQRVVQREAARAQQEAATAQQVVATVQRVVALWPFSDLNFESIVGHDMLEGFVSYYEFDAGDGKKVPVSKIS